MRSLVSKERKTHLSAVPTPQLREFFTEGMLLIAAAARADRYLRVRTVPSPR